MGHPRRSFLEEHEATQVAASKRRRFLTLRKRRGSVRNDTVIFLNGLLLIGRKNPTRVLRRRAPKRAPRTGMGHPQTLQRQTHSTAGMFGNFLTHPPNRRMGHPRKLLRQKQKKDPPAKAAGGAPGDTSKTKAKTGGELTLGLGEGGLEFLVFGAEGGIFGIKLLHFFE